MGPKPPVLVLPAMTPAELAALEGLIAPVHVVNGVGLERVPAAVLAPVRCVLTTGPVGFPAAMFDLCPAVEAVISFGAGYDRVDLSRAAARGVLLATGAGANARAVAEHAFALLLGLSRRIPALDRHVRAGGWRTGEPAFDLGGRRIGILGLGAIGRLVAGIAAGFGMEVAYTARSAKPDVPYRHVPQVRDLAGFSDILVVACQGGRETRHLVDAAVLAALGPGGILVNVARGSVVDTAALVAALESGGIRGAALDVFEDEPGVPSRLIALPNTVLTPHVGGNSEDSRAAMIAMACANIEAFLTGRPMPGRVDYLEGS